jgi:hypothetical protein
VRIEFGKVGRRNRKRDQTVGLARRGCFALEKYNMMANLSDMKARKLLQFIILFEHVAMSSINLFYLKCSEKIETFIISDVYRSFQYPLKSLLILFGKRN